MNRSEKPNLFRKRDLLFLGLILLGAGALGLQGIARLGYIGQDFDGIGGHNHLIRTFPQSYSYALTNPPGLYWLGNLIFRFSDVYYLEILAAFFLAINLAALALFFRLIWQMIAAWPLRYAAAALIAFMPFRAIHSIVIAADAFTAPLFAVMVTLALTLIQNPRRPLAWGALSLTCSVAFLCKYTFLGAVAAIVFVLGCTLWRTLKQGERLRWGGAGLLAVAIPAGIFLLQMRESAKLAGSSTYGHWKTPEAPSEMAWKDILLLKARDLEIFSAPHYFRDQVYETRRHSYPALVHLTSFTDSQNYFQPPPVNISPHWRHRYHQGFSRERSSRAQTFAAWSVAWCVPLSLLAIAGTLVCGALTAHAVIFPARALVSPATVVVTAGAIGFYGMVFFNLPRVGDPYVAGYWLPRLVLPGLLMFFCLGLTALDLVQRQFGKSERRKKTVDVLCLLHVTVACGLFVGVFA